MGDSWGKGARRIAVERAIAKSPRSCIVDGRRREEPPGGAGKYPPGWGWVPGHPRALEICTIDPARGRGPRTVAGGRPGRSWRAFDRGETGLGWERGALEAFSVLRGWMTWRVYL